MKARGLVRRLTPLVAGCLLCAALAPDGAKATAPGVNGRIAFATNRDGGASEIYVMRADGGDPTRLTRFPGEDLEPRWSPDGTQVAFTSDRDGNFELYVMKADGTAPTRLTTSPGLDGQPSWSPDGARIAFTSERDGDAEIYVMNADGTGAANLTHSPATTDSTPAWSPDGSLIVFARDVGGGSDLYAMSADGSGLAVLVSGPGDDAEPTWAPDGGSLAFTSERDGNPEIYAVAADGSNPRRLTDDPAVDRRPAWSPNGLAIAFETDRDGNAEIYVMRADGTGVHDISRDPSRDSSPDWQAVPGLSQPDLAVAPARTGSFVGGDVYGSGARQTLRVRGAPGLTKLYVVRLENDGNRRDDFALTGTGSRGGLRVRYLWSGSDVTARVVHGRLHVALAPHRRTVVSVEVTVAAGARAGRTATVRLQAVSSGEAPLRDAVRIAVRIRPVAPYSYGWPVKPFFVQHPVRGQFGDPRIGNSEFAGIVHAFHFGVDVVAPDGTPVYATVSGYVLLDPFHQDKVTVERLDGEMLEYRHLVPSVRAGTVAVAYHTVIGRIRRGWGHVHVSNLLGGDYVNPLRAGGMGPYSDDTDPAVTDIVVRHAGRDVEGPVRGDVDLVARVLDTAPMPLRAPWERSLFTPALLRWRIVADDGREAISWRTAFDVRFRLPAVPYPSVYAPGTRQNRPNRPGSYLFYLARGWRSSELADGGYALQVAATDVRGNTVTAKQPLLVANGS
jgi:murein DD-endopeptidase MepM/ murein hydrolase activator NlpD